MTTEELQQAGAMLYACEGTVLRRDKRGPNRYYYSIELTNSRPQIIALFCRFLREVLDVDDKKIKGQLFIYPDHNERDLIDFWSKASKIPPDRFQKIIHLKQKNSKYQPNPRGTFKIRYNSKEDFLRLQGMIDGVWNKAGVA